MYYSSSFTRREEGQRHIPPTITERGRRTRTEQDRRREPFFWRRRPWRPAPYSLPLLLNGLRRKPAFFPSEGRRQSERDIVRSTTNIRDLGLWKVLLAKELTSTNSFRARATERTIASEWASCWGKIGKESSDLQTRLPHNEAPKEKKARSFFVPALLLCR